MKEVFVVMGNDYPDAVFDNEEAAERYCEDRRAFRPAYAHQRIYWRVYAFGVRS